MTPHLLFLIALAILFGTAGKLLHRYVLKETEPYAYALLNNIIGAIFFLPLALKNFALPNVGVPWIILGVSSVLWTILAGIAIFREREHLLQRIAAAAIIVTGSVLVRF